MSPDLVTYLAYLAGYLAVACGVFFWIWRASRRITKIGFRLALRAFVLAFLFAPGALACEGVSIIPFSLIVAVVAGVVDLSSPNGCGPDTSWSLASFLATFAIAAVALYILDRHRHGRVAL